MAHPEGLSQWTEQVARELPPLSAAQARVLALWSYGMMFTRSCACHTVAVFLALVLGKGYHALRQCLREWCYDAEDKRGLNRRAVDVPACFAPLLGWVLRPWPDAHLTHRHITGAPGYPLPAATIFGHGISFEPKVLAFNREGDEATSQRGRRALSCTRVVSWPSPCGSVMRTAIGRAGAGPQ